WTDFLQGILMFLTLLVVPMFVVVLVGGWGSVQSGVVSVDPSHATILKGMTFLGMISLLAWGLGYFGQPHILARFMALRSERDVPRATLIGMSWMVLALIGAVATGYLGIAYFADTPIADGETVLIELIRALFNPWVAGVLMAAILAAIMSTIDSQLIVSASAITNDFYRGMVRSDAGATELVWISRVAVIGVSLIALLLAMDPDAGVLDLVSYAWGGFGAAFGPVIILSLYWSRMNRNGALGGMVVGALTVIVWKELSGGVFDVYELLPGFLLATVAIVVVSQLTGRPSVEVEKQFAQSRQVPVE
ncbi:MAG: sodium/solute symporter, partial [Thioalkalivibrio sp.]|nr:sodium/solute symporter [Thioalkalivibrio sp.]